MRFKVEKVILLLIVAASASCRGGGYQPRRSASPEPAVAAQKQEVSTPDIPFKLRLIKGPADEYAGPRGSQDLLAGEVVRKPDFTQVRDTIWLEKLSLDSRSESAYWTFGEQFEGERILRAEFVRRQSGSDHSWIEEKESRPASFSDGEKMWFISLSQATGSRLEDLDPGRLHQLRITLYLESGRLGRHEVEFRVGSPLPSAEAFLPRALDQQQWITSGRIRAPFQTAAHSRVFDLRTVGQRMHESGYAFSSQLLQNPTQRSLVLWVRAGLSRGSLAQWVNSLPPEMDCGPNSGSRNCSQISMSNRIALAYEHLELERLSSGEGARAIGLGEQVNGWLRIPLSPQEVVAIAPVAKLQNKNICLISSIGFRLRTGMALTVFSLLVQGQMETWISDESIVNPEDLVLPGRGRLLSIRQEPLFSMHNFNHYDSSMTLDQIEALPVDSRICDGWYK